MNQQAQLIGVVIRCTHHKNTLAILLHTPLRTGQYIRFVTEQPGAKKVTNFTQQVGQMKLLVGKVVLAQPPQTNYAIGDSVVTFWTKERIQEGDRVYLVSAPS